MAVRIHVNKPSGYFIAQVKRFRARRWRTVDNERRHDSAVGALVAAVLAMKADDKRARVLWVTDDGWYDPDVRMEARRT